MLSVIYLARRILKLYFSFLPELHTVTKYMLFNPLPVGVFARAPGEGGVCSPRLTREPVALARWARRQLKLSTSTFLGIKKIVKSHKPCQG